MRTNPRPAAERTRPRSGQPGTSPLDPRPLFTESARPLSGVRVHLAAGRYEFDVSDGRRMLLAVPPAGPVDSPLPLIVMLHGAGGDPRDALAVIEHEAARRRLLVLAPRSERYTWDALVGDL